MTKIKIQFTDFWGGYDPNDNFWTIMFNRLNIPYEVVNDNSDFLIASVFGVNWSQKRTKKKILWSGENWYRMTDKVLNPGGYSFVDLFDMVYSFDYNNVNNHYRLPLYLIDTIENEITEYQQYRNLSKDQLYDKYKTSKFCTFVQGNGNCKFRNDYFDSLNKIEKVDSYGSLFNNTGKTLSRKEKIEVTKDYKFALTFENSEYDGYVSEKIVDGFKSGVLPIYWGGSKVSNDFNSNSFVDVNTLGLEKSLDLVNNLNKDFDLYWEYYNQPIVSNDLVSIESRIYNFENQFKTFILSNV